MIREHKNIIKDISKRKLFLRRELDKLILKILFQNRYDTNARRFYIRITSISHKKKGFLSFQKKKCLMTGQSKSIFKNFEIKRHQIKKLNNIGMVQNLSLKKW